jgi:hypothetical protein
VPAPALAGEAFVVALKATFQCKSCSFAAPLDHLDVDGSVDCLQCGVRQRFDVESWREALAFAHGVGDLAGPDPEGRSSHEAVWIGGDNPHRDVGVELTFAVLAEEGTQRVDGLTLERSLRVEVAPGHPACRKCLTLLTVTLAGDKTASTSCPKCAETGTYTLPDGASALASGLVAAIADEHRTDRPRAKEAGGGVQTLSCPSCGGPLKLQAYDRTATCEYCHTACLIPVRALLREGEAPRPRIWWLAFSGRSAKRTELESGAGFSLDTYNKAVADAAGYFTPVKPRRNLIGEDPGVYEAPEAAGPNLKQLAVTFVLGVAALVIGALIAHR